jgi:tripartite-type tricarboxylate transporter receptor subunit TctC
MALPPTMRAQRRRFLALLAALPGAGGVRPAFGTLLAAVASAPAIGGPPGTSAPATPLSGSLPSTPAAPSQQQPGPPQRWPARPIRLLLAYPPGGVSDAVARQLAEQLSRQLAVRVLVEHRPGAGGALAMEALARSTPDGHTLGFAAATAVALVTTTAQRQAGALPVTPVAGVMRTPVLVVGTPALRARTFPAMLAVAATEPGGIRWATTGEGTTGHAVLERVRQASGAAIVHIPYKGGGQQLTDALAGHFEVLSTNVAAQQLEAIRTGRFTALGVGAPERLPVLPDTPTLAELGHPQANLDSLFGVFAPPGLPAPLVRRLNGEVATALQWPELRGKLLEASNLPFAGSAETFAARVRLEGQR